MKRPLRSGTLQDPAIYHFVYIGFDATGAGGAAGDIANVTQVFQPWARLWASNSQ